MKKVVLINRCPHSGQFSIENIFSALSNSFRSLGFNVEQYISPFQSKGFLFRLFNAIHVTLYQRDVCHIVGDVTYLALFMRRKSLVITFHDLNIYDRKSGLGRYLIGLFWYRIPLYKAKVVTAISEDTRQQILAKFKVAPDRVRVVPNPLLTGFTFTRKKPIDPASVIDILQIGTKNNKNLERVMAALEVLSLRYPIRLTIVGHLPNVNVLDGVKNLQILNRFDLSLDEIVSLYQQTQLVLFASTSEGFGMPIIEAQAVGRPILTSNIEPMLSVSGGAAQFVDPLSVLDIQKGIEKLITDQKRTDELVERGLENARLYSIQKVAEQYGKLYVEVLDEL